MLDGTRGIPLRNVPSPRLFYHGVSAESLASFDVAVLRCGRWCSPNVPAPTRKGNCTASVRATRQFYEEHLHPHIGRAFVLFHWFTPCSRICPLALCITRLAKGNTPSPVGFPPSGDGVRPLPMDDVVCKRITPLSNCCKAFPLHYAFAHIIALSSPGVRPVQLHFVL